MASYITKPKIIFSLHQSLENDSQNHRTNSESVSVTVPKVFSAYFTSPKITSLRLQNEQPDWAAHSLSDDVVQIDLSPIISHHQDEHGLFFYLVSLQPTAASFDIRILDSTARVQKKTSSGLLPAGEIVWRDTFASAKIQDCVLQLSIDSPNSKAYLCDFVMYDAPGIRFWDIGE